MPDTPQVDQSQIDYLDHPTLGRLGFPKTMGAGDRNSIIDGMLQSAPTPQLPGGTERLTQAARGLPSTLTQPTKFEKDRAGASPDLFGGSSSTGGGILHNIRTSLLPSLDKHGPTANPDDYASGPAFTGGSTPQMARQRLQAGTQSAENDAARSQVGRSLPYRAAAATNEALGTANPKAMEDLADVGNKRGILGQAYGPEAAAVLPAALGMARTATTGARQALAQKLVQPLVYEGVGEAGADSRLGIQPDRGIVREGIWGTKGGMARDINDRVSQLKPAANSILANSPGGRQFIDASGPINSAIDDAVQNAKGRGSPEMIPRLENLRQALLTEHGPTGGNALEMNDLKSKIQGVAGELGAYKNTVPAEASAANAAGRAAHGVREQVNSAVPEGAPLNERMADLMDAGRGINRSILADKGKDILAHGTINRAMQRTVGSPLVRSGAARLLTLGDALDVPPVMPPPPGPGPQFPSPAGPPAAHSWTPPPTQPPVGPGPGVNAANAAEGPPLWQPQVGDFHPNSMWKTGPNAVVPSATTPVSSNLTGAPPPSGPSPAPNVSAPQSSSAPPVLPPIAPAPINPQEVADFTRILREQGYQGPITADNINDLMRQGNAIRSNAAPGRVDTVSPAIEARRATLTQPKRK